VVPDTGVRTGASRRLACKPMDPALTEYDPAWPAAYEREAVRVAAALGPAVVELAHVGSTAVPALAGKGTIDIAAGLTTPELGPDEIAAMEALGYEAVLEEPRRRFRQGEAVPWRFIVHVVEWGSAAWRDQIAFRDALRADPALTREYDALKRRLLSERGVWYSGADKRAFVEAVLAQARPVLELLSHSPVETEAIASGVARGLEPGDVVTVSGELGAGKTTFVRGACTGLGVTEPITSPTFTIGHRYRGSVDVSHLDLFRFAAVSPAEWADLEPYFDDAVVFVEWPEAGEGVLPSPRARVTLGHVDRERRWVRIAGDDAALLEGVERADPVVRHGH
jgi:tRNA threonylcarbamoyladenosine biosynthesis protein TsaE